LQQLGKYRIVAEIGRGAMGEVYRAHDPVLNRDVAIKTISGRFATDEQFRQRFRREAQSAAKLNHPNIITVFDFEDSPDGVYMAMELLEGRDLKEVVARRALADLDDRLNVIEQVCEGLAFAHERGVIHRDLKPGNIHLLPNGTVKVLDFGLARIGSSDLTATGTVLGTPNYMSPEQVKGQKADARSDVFSLGAVFYELMTWHKPFDAPSTHSILFQVLEHEPEPVRSVAPEVPEAVVEVILRALRKDPGARFQHAGEMRAALIVVRRQLAAADATVIGGVDATIAELPGGTLATMPAPASLPPRGGRSSLVSGTAALEARPQSTVDRTPVPPRTVRPPRTEPGRVVGGRSRAPLYAVGLLVLAAGAGLAYWMTRRAAPAAPPADVSREQLGILTEALVASQVELAQADLQSKDYAGAIEEAAKALQIDPANAAALTVQEQARAKLAQVEEAAKSARAALDRGDTAAAAAALEAVLAIDPRHPVAAELSAALNRHFSDQAAAARRAALEAQKTAERSAGGTPDFAAARRLSTEAEGLLQRQEYAVAAQKYLESRDRFDSARGAAEAAAARPTPRPVPAAGSPSPTTPSVIVTASTPSPLAVPTATPWVAPPPTVTPPTAAPPPLATPFVPPAPAAVTLPTPAAKALIQRVIEDYARAIANKDVGLFKSVMPNLSAADEKRLQQFFKAFKSHQVVIAILDVRINNGQAVVHAVRRDKIEGRTVPETPQTFRLVQGPGGWTIDSIGQ